MARVASQTSDSAAAVEAPVTAKPPFNASSTAGVTASSAIAVKAISAIIASPESHAASTVGSSLATVANASGFDTPADTPSSTRDAKAGPTIDDPSTAKTSSGGVKIVTDAQATDALAAEALDATDGAFPVKYVVR